jgi:hypothetical protein
VSHAEYLEDLSRIGMGWMGWTSEQTDDHLMTDIELAYEGRLKMIQLISPFGGDGVAAPAKPVRKLTPELFDAMFG